MSEIVVNTNSFFEHIEEMKKLCDSEDIKSKLNTLEEEMISSGDFVEKIKSINQELVCINDDIDILINNTIEAMSSININYINAEDNSEKLWNE